MWANAIKPASASNSFCQDFNFELNPSGNDKKLRLISRVFIILHSRKIVVLLGNGQLHLRYAESQREVIILNKIELERYIFMRNSSFFSEKERFII